jgi:hypothetical protein
MYAAQPFMDYTDDAAVSVAARDVNGDGAADVALVGRSIKSPRDVATGQAAGLVGDFNNDGRDDVAEVVFESQTRPHADGILIGMLLPYMEQDNVYNVGNGLGVDVWEHASFQGPQTNGIIAVLIGLMQDVTDGTSNTMMLTADPSDASGNTASSAILASEEFFSRFANTTFDDTAQVTHDEEFEGWANASRFDRGYLPPVGNSILHEENEFSFPRMIRGR